MLSAFVFTEKFTLNHVKVEIKRHVRGTKPDNEGDLIQNDIHALFDN